MSSLNYATLEGGVVRVEEPHQYTDKNGNARTIVNFTVALDVEKYDAASKTYTKLPDQTVYERVTVTGRLADNVIKTFKPGDRVVVFGERRGNKPYVDKNGQARPSNSIYATMVGASLTIYPAEILREKGGNYAGTADLNKPAPKPGFLDTTPEDMDPSRW
jgi:hypothetical protein